MLAVGTSGQLLQTNGAAAPTWVTVSTGPTLGTVVATTSGTQAEFTGIPATVKQVVIMFGGVSFSASDQLHIQLSTSAAYKTSGYVSVGSYQTSGPLVTEVNATGAIVPAGGQPASGSTIYYGLLTLNLLNSATNLWVYSSAIGMNIGGAGASAVMSGSATLTAALNKLKVYGSAGGTFDAGSINIAYF
jgi:hypothetical protein